MKTERTLDSIWEELRIFGNLKPPEQEKERERKGKDLEGIEVEQSSNSKAIETAVGDLEIAKAKRKSNQSKREDEREKRRNALALGENDKQFVTSLSNLTEEQDSLEDLCVGLERRIEGLRAEGEFMDGERIEIKKTISRYRLVPLVTQYNEVGEKLAGILKQIFVLADELGEPFYEIRTGARTIFYSQWEGIDAIARLFLADEVEDPNNKWPNGKLRDIFNFRELMEEFRQKIEKAAVT